MGMLVHLNKHLFLRLLVLFMVFGFLFSGHLTQAQSPGDEEGLATEAARAAAETEAATKSTTAEPSKTTDTKTSTTDREGARTESASWIYNVSIILGGWIAGLGGSIFDLAMDRVVLKMGCWFVKDPAGATNYCDTVGAGTIGGVVNELWTVIRDLFNILFIFALVYIGLRTILNSSDSGTQKALGMLIAAALLINFSLYITKVVVDVTNYTAVSIYSVAISGTSLKGDSEGYSYTATTDKVDGQESVSSSYTSNGVTLSAAYMETLRISSWFAGSPVDGTFQAVVFSIILLIFSIVLGLTLGYGGIMLITRFIALIIFMIFSPAMFLGWILPQFKKYSDMWWQKFMAYAFFAPAYIFMLYIGLYTLVQIKKTNIGLGEYSDAFGDSVTSDSFGIFLFFAIGIGFLVAATKVGESMSIAGSSSAIGALKGFKNKTLGATKWGAKYGAGYAASATTGYGARKIGGWMDKGREGKEAPRGRITRAIRNTVKSGETAKWGGSQSSKERGDADKAEAKTHARNHAVYKLKTQLGKQTSEAEKQQAFADMSNSQLIDIAKSKDGKSLIMSNAGLLSASQMKAISDSEDINDNVTSEMGAKRKEATIKRVKDGKLKVEDATKDQLGALGVEELVKPANAFALSEDKIKALDIIDVYKDQIKNARKQVIKDVAAGKSGDDVGNVTKTDLLKAKPGDIAKYPADALKAMAKELSTATLTKIVVDNTQSTPDQREIRTAIETFIKNNKDSAKAKTYADFFTSTPAGKSFGT